MSEVIELARFRVRPGEEAAFIQKRPAMAAAAFRELPGLLRLELVQLDSGVWVDVVVWMSREHAEAALARADSIPVFGDWLAHILADTGMDHGVIHDSHSSR